MVEFDYRLPPINLFVSPTPGRYAVAGTPESKFKKKVREFARSIGYTVADNIASGYSQRGRADMSLTIGFVGIEVEVKAEQSVRITPLQLNEHKLRVEHGQLHVFVYPENFEAFKALLKHLKELSECQFMQYAAEKLRSQMSPSLLRLE
jgi:hypothetical protein